MAAVQKSIMCVAKLTRSYTWQSPLFGLPSNIELKLAVAGETILNYCTAQASPRYPHKISSKSYDTTTGNVSVIAIGDLILIVGAVRCYKLSVFEKFDLPYLVTRMQLRSRGIFNDFVQPSVSSGTLAAEI